MNRATALLMATLAGTTLMVTACDRKPAEPPAPKTSAPAPAPPPAASAPTPTPPAAPTAEEKKDHPPIQGQVDPKSQGQSKDFEVKK